ncbi:hypothetical protein O181_089484 [Austropuccinia psidii MF-1]|uniref:DNA-binding protein RAP1 n=1 Tax=Austropuccinia psidii MF-1 TaxID=1389203 RepID=A0A9Q3P5M6_9BASI|nr:hypothetical protein [Austropuccinia psidii MF-1]
MSSSRNPFTLVEQEELAAFLATYAGSRHGNSAYKAFSVKHPSHSWQSWRSHYLTHKEAFDIAIRRKIKDRRRLETSPSAMAAVAAEAATSAELQARDSNQEPFSDNQSSKASETQKPPRSKETSNRRSARKRSYSLTNSTNECLGNSDGGAQHSSTTVLTMTSAEEEDFLDFLHGFSKEDLRSSLSPYLAYHQKMPTFSSTQYQSYYLENYHRFKDLLALEKSAFELCDPQAGQSTAALNGLLQTSLCEKRRQSSSVALSSLEPHLAAQNSPMSINDTLLDVDALSVSTGSSDDLDLESMLTDQVPRHSSISKELLISLQKLRHNFFYDLKDKALHEAGRDLASFEDSPSDLPDVENHAEEAQLDYSETNEIQPIVPTPEAEQQLTISGQTSRTNSFKPAKEPVTLEEAIELVSEFLKDFGDLYSGREALELFRQCGNWTLMFEIATLEKMEKEAKNEMDWNYATKIIQAQSLSLRLN